MEFFASAAHGAENVLGEELFELGFRQLRRHGGGVSFIGEREDGWRACLYSRIAQRIMTPLGRFPAADPEALYAGGVALPWETVLTPRHTLAVAAFCRDGQITHSDFAALKLKDAIVDRLRQVAGERPTVNRDNPDLRVFLHLVADQATVYLDLAGEPLFRRGYRTEAGEAPLRETMAATLLRLCNWDRRQPLLDPMCGSGTIAIEAALWAADIPPGIFRQQFGFERWPSHDAAAAEVMAEMRGAARRNRHGQMPRITATDLDPAVLDIARRNARAAGVRISFKEADVRELRGLEPPLNIITNPPYGIRLAAEGDFFRDLGTAFSRLHGCRLGLLAGCPELTKIVPVSPGAEYELYNGDIPCRFLVYEIP